MAIWLSICILGSFFSKANMYQSWKIQKQPLFLMRHFQVGEKDEDRRLPLIQLGSKLLEKGNLSNEETSNVHMLFFPENY